MEPRVLHVAQEHTNYQRALAVKHVLHVYLASGLLCQREFQIVTHAMPSQLRLGQAL